MNRKFLGQLKIVHQDFIEMGLEAAEAIKLATEAFENHDLELASKVIEHDEVINNLEIKLEKKTSQLIALQQPVATNLRKVIAILKASSDVERIGDHAVDVAKAVRNINVKRRNVEIESLIREVSEQTQENLVKIVSMFAKFDEKGAVEIAKKNQGKREKINEIRKLSINAIKEDANFAEEGIDYLSIIAHIKRINDYITNLAEWIVYEEEGKITELTF